MANSRISDLSQKQVLLSNGFDQFADDNSLFIMAREKSHNESVAYKDLKVSINDYSVLITGDQNITGEKSFYDNAFFKKDVRIDGDLRVQGDVFNLQFRDNSGQDLDQYLTNLDSNLSVAGNAELLSDVIVSQNFTTVGDTELQGDAVLKNNLNVEKKSSFIGDSDFQSDVEIVGNQNLSGLLTVHDNAEFKKNVLVGKDLTVQGDVFNIKFEDNAGNSLDSYITDFDSNLRVKGMSTLDKQVTAKEDLTVLGSQVIEGNIKTEGQALFEQDATILGTLNVTGLSTHVNLTAVGGLTVEKDSLFKSNTSTHGDAEFFSDIILAQDISIGGSQDLQGNLTVHDNAEFKKDVLVGNNLTVRGDLFNIKFNDGAGGDADQYLTDFDSNLKVKGELGISGDALLDSTLDVTGPTTLSDTLDVAKKTTISDNFDVSGDTTLKKTDVDGNLTVVGAEARFTVAQAVFEQDVEVQGDLSIKGDLFNVKFDDGFGGNADNYLTDFDSNLQVKGNLGITGDADLHSNLKVGNELEVTNKTNLMDELEAFGDVNFQSKLDVSDATSLADTLNVAKKTTLLDDLDVAGDVNLQSKLDVADAVALLDTLDVTKKTTLSDDLDVTGDADLKAELDVAGATALADTLDVTKKTTLSDDLDVTGNADLKSKLDVAGATALADTLDVTKKTTLSDDLDVTGDADLKSKLDVAGATALADTLDVTKDVSLGDNLSVENILQLGPRTGISQGYFNLYQDDPASKPGDGQFLSFKHKDQPNTGASGGLFLSEAGRVGINTYNENAMLNIEQPSSVLGLSISSQPSEQATMFLYELGQSKNLTLGSGPLPSLSIPGVIPLSALYAEKVAFVESIEQDLVIYATTAGTNVHVGAGDKKLLTFTGTTDSHPVSGIEAGNDVIFSADSNVGINVAEVALSPVTQDKFKLHVDGEVKIDGRLFATDVFETYPVIPKVGDVHMGATVLRPQNVYDAGDQGTLFFDDDYIFVCVQDSDGTDQNRVAWKRFAISEW